MNNWNDSESLWGSFILFGWYLTDLKNRKFHIEYKENSKHVPSLNKLVKVNMFCALFPANTQKFKLKFSNISQLIVISCWKYVNYINTHT